MLPLELHATETREGKIAMTERWSQAPVPGHPRSSHAAANKANVSHKSVCPACVSGIQLLENGADTFHACEIAESNRTSNPARTFQGGATETSTLGFAITKRAAAKVQPAHVGIGEIASFK
jgi:hypothetical protein